MAVISETCNSSSRLGTWICYNPTLAPLLFLPSSVSLHSSLFLLSFPLHFRPFLSSYLHSSISSLPSPIFVPSALLPLSPSPRSFLPHYFHTFLSTFFPHSLVPSYLYFPSFPSTSLPHSQLPSLTLYFPSFPPSLFLYFSFYFPPLLSTFLLNSLLPPSISTFLPSLPPICPHCLFLRLCLDCLFKKLFLFPKSDTFSVCKHTFETTFMTFYNPTFYTTREHQF